MIRTEQRSVPVLTSGTVSVDGLVRVRSFSTGRGSWRVCLESHEPVAIVVRRGGGSERVGLRKASSMSPLSMSPLWMLIAMPLAARVARTLLTRR